MRLKLTIIPVLIILMLLCSCYSITSKVAVDVRFTKEHYVSEIRPAFGIATNGQPATTFVIQDVYYQDTWEVKYLLTYNDGKIMERWEEVSQSEYEIILDELKARESENEIL